MAEVNPSDAPMNGAGVGTSETVGTKRQRRPSVRLGDIGGDPPYESYLRRTASSTTNRQWKHQLNPLIASKSSKTRTLTTLSSDFNADDEKDPKSNNLDGIAIGSWRVKDSKKRGSATKRVRSNWVSKVDENSNGNGNGNGNSNNVGGDDKYSDGGEYAEFEVENSESPLKEQSPIHSLDNNLGREGNERDLLYHGRRPISTTRGTNNRVRENRDQHEGGMELSAPSDSEMRRCGEDAVRIWLNGLGLGRYAPIFEIHEVDDEVLPMLTLEDLKDMRINAVGSRRKLFCAIQKLGKGFS